jgi:O-methyltransferase involved in polyketide biosynthesis
MEHDQKIGPTAYYTAYVWHRLGLPHAELFATTTGATLFWGFRLGGEWVAAALPGIPSMSQYLAQRHLAIEHALAEHNPDRIIELGAGLSRRGVTWAVDRGVPYVEVDLPHMVDAKRARIPEELRARAGERLAHESHDVLAPDFADRLRVMLGDAKRPAIVAEGLLGYFPRGERFALTRAIATALSGRDGIFLSDHRGSEGGPVIALATQALKACVKLVTRGRGAAEDFRDAADIRAFFADAGFASATPVDLREVPNAPRVPPAATVWRARSAQ